MNKKILFSTGIFPPQIGGPATYVLKMANRMSKDGFDIAVITYSDNMQKEKYGLNVFRISWTFFIFTYLKFFFKILIVGRKYDVIFLQGTFLEGIPTVFANFFLKKKLIIRIGGIYSWETSIKHKWTFDNTDDFLKNKQKFIPEIFKKIDCFIISKCDKVIANSYYIKKLLLLNKVKKSKIEVIYNPVELAPFENISQQRYKEEKRFSNKKILLYVGRLVPWKNLDRLINFSKKLDNEFVVAFAGEGPEKEALMNLAKINNLEEKIIFLGKLGKSELNKLYQVADAVILISSFEGLSHVLIEAMRFNLPIIASGIEPNKEVLEGYNNCQLININEEEFLMAMRKLNFNKNKNTLNLDRFDFENIYKKTLQILCE